MKEYRGQQMWSFFSPDFFLPVGSITNSTRCFSAPLSEQLFHHFLLTAFYFACGSEQLFHHLSRLI